METRSWAALEQGRIINTAPGTTVGAARPVRTEDQVNRAIRGDQWDLEEFNTDAPAGKVPSSRLESQVDW